MRTRLVAVTLLLAFAPVAAARPARAQTAAEDPTTDIARARFKEGVGFYDKGQYEQARAAFLQAYALKKHPAVLLNLAWSSLKSGHTLEAEHYFKQFLADSKDLTDKQKADATDGLTQSHAKLGRIEVAATAGTEVTIDGDRAGIAPLAEPVVVEPGAHTVKFRGPDGATDTDSVTVLAGEKAIARFAKTATAAPPAAVVSPPPSTGDTESPSPPPESTAETPAPHADVTPSTRDHSESSHTGLVIGGSVLLGVGAVTIFTGLVIGIGSKGSAQSKANDVAAQIRAAGGTSCNPPSPSSINGIQGACAQWVADNNDVNHDATAGNILGGIGAAAVIVGGALLVTGLVMNHHLTSGALQMPQVTPVVGRDMNGLSISGSF